MLVCVECGTSVKALHSSYGLDNIVLETCPECREVADKYCELDDIIKLIDLILHKLPVYRHLLINSSLNFSLRRAVLYFVYMGMINVHLHQGEVLDFYYSFKLFLSSVIGNLIYVNVLILLLRLGGVKIDHRRIINAVILGSFPHLLHLLFVIWDYPRNDQFNTIIQAAVFTSNFTSLRSICLDSKFIVVVMFVAKVLMILGSKLVGVYKN